MVAVGVVEMPVMVVVAVLTPHCMLLLCCTLTPRYYMFYIKCCENQTKKTANVLYWDGPHSTVIQSVK
jgi:hypothetical protein